MVFSSAPDLCSNLVLAAVDLLNPSIKYRGHICEYTSLNSLKESSRGDIIGVCNPFIVESDKKHFLIISEGSYEGGSEIGNDITVKKSNLSGKKQSTKTLEKKLANTELEFEADKIVEPSMNTRPDSSPTLRRSKAELLTIPFSWLSGGMSSSLPFKRSGKVGTSMPSASYKHNGESNLKDSSQTTAAFLGSRMSSSSKGSQVTTSNKSTNNARSKGAITNISAINHRNNELLMHHLFLKENVQFLSQLNKLLINYDSQEGDVGIDFARNMDSDSTQGNHPRITSDNIDAFIKSHFTRVISKLLEPLRLHIEENGYFDYDIFSSTFLMPTSIPKKNPSPIMSTDSIENVKDEGLSKNLNTNYSRAVKTGIMNLRQLASAQIYGQNLNLGNSNISLTESSENPLKNKRLNLGADDNTHDMFIDHQHCIDFYRRFTQTCSFGDWCQERTKMTQLAQTKKRELFGNESDEIW
ncbi:hypothetical protein NADFUDRAFT_69194 [Nadsonia fulvescens var. elongata DSM 6958]|uniref:Uncharacterized protein n=1 Tax=Nadsonia fulvescens var. elongata DSM 6958 TaxID=857566 RepID=A0A1E3PPL2_9ASCO|nr:hypothetical protein NADFUDRAFT_69194 [Nadsonia fulvescens var. elongata DSM 6958]